MKGKQKDKKQPKQEAIDFGLNNIELLGVNLNHPNEPIQNTNFQFEINSQQKFHPKEKTLVVEIRIDVSHKEIEQEVLGSISVACIFELNVNNQDIDYENKQVSLPDEIFVTINSISISTARGIMFSEFKGTFLDQAHLPVVDPRTISEKMTHQKG